MKSAILKAEQALARIVEATISSPARTLIVISGLTCSGKTFFADLVASHLRKQNCPPSIIRQDCYFRDLDDPELPRTENGQKPILDSPFSFHNDEFLAHAFMLLRGCSIRMPQYEVARNRRITGFSETVEPGPAVEAEGLFAIRLLHRIRYEPAISVFMDTPVEVCLERRIRRDKELYGIPQESVERNFREIILVNFQKYLNSQKELANLIVTQE